MLFQNRRNSYGELFQDLSSSLTFLSFQLFAAEKATKSTPEKYGRLQIRLRGLEGNYINIPVNDRPVAFESALFKGQVAVRIKDAEGAPETDFFKEKRKVFTTN